ncbi:MAG: gephyrin-like molybdotransferase Glp, partial [Polyangiaceae bacterium]
MLSFDEAQARIVAAATVLAAETVPLDHVLGRVLAEDLRTAADQPAFDASTMD